MKPLTESEKKYLLAFQARWREMRDYLNANELDFGDDVDTWFHTVAGFRNLQGNISNSASFLACLQAKFFLGTRFDISGFDVADKAQGAPGLDIDFTSHEMRIVGEIKTTVPYSGAKNDFGAQQKKSFKADFRKLANEPADYKFLFLTDPKTHEIILRKYAGELLGVEIVLLTDIWLKFDQG